MNKRELLAMKRLHTRRGGGWFPSIGGLAGLYVGYKGVQAAKSGFSSLKSGATNLYNKAKSMVVKPKQYPNGTIQPPDRTKEIPGLFDKLSSKAKRVPIKDIPTNFIPPAKQEALQNMDVFYDASDQMPGEINKAHFASQFKTGGKRGPKKGVVPPHLKKYLFKKGGKREVDETQTGESKRPYGHFDNMNQHALPVTDPRNLKKHEAQRWRKLDEPRPMHIGGKRGPKKGVVPPHLKKFLFKKGGKIGSKKGVTPPHLLPYLFKKAIK